jgi:hypothetical protein
MVDEARRSTEQSSAVVKDAVSAMGRIEQASGEIGQIINVIDEFSAEARVLPSSPRKCANWRNVRPVALSPAQAAKSDPALSS